MSLYTNGPFTDLCRGPHAPSTKRIKAFKLQSVAGAYWRGDSNKPMLTRDLRHRVLLREGPRRSTSSGSSRRGRATTARLGPQLGLFNFSDVAPGIDVLAPGRDRGVQLAGRASREMGGPRGYTEVKTPQLYDSSLWKTSGHWDKYQEHMFITESADRRWRSSR